MVRRDRSGIALWAGFDDGRTQYASASAIRLHRPHVQAQHCGPRSRRQVPGYPRRAMTVMLRLQYDGLVSCSTGTRLAEEDGECRASCFETRRLTSQRLSRRSTALVVISIWNRRDSISRPVICTPRRIAAVVAARLQLLLAGLDGSGHGRDSGLGSSVSQ